MARKQKFNPNIIQIILFVLVGILAAILSTLYLRNKELNVELDVAKQQTAKEFVMAKAFEKASPSVVLIYSAVTVDDSLELNSLGSGTILSKDGYIVTNYHVVQNSTDNFSLLSNGESYTISMVGYDILTDIALLKIDSERTNFTPIAISKRTPKVGEPVLAIGNPYNLGQTATFGIISAVSRINVGNIGYQSFIQTDAVLNYGNSGGALVDTQGNFIGMNTLTIDKVADRPVSGLGFALNNDTVMDIATQLQRYGIVNRGYFGVHSVLLSYSAQSHALVIKELNSNSFAYKSGLRVNDIILDINGKTFASPLDIIAYVNQFPVGSTLYIKVKRGEHTLQFSVVLSAIATT